MSIHSNFIYTPISDILEDAANATQCIEQSIDVYPLCDYIMQSIFMKMTGAQEQKMKCICWELATVDFEIRRDLYSNWSLGECSSLNEKNKILGILIKAILKMNNDFDAKSAINRHRILVESKEIINRFYKVSSIKSFGTREFDVFMALFDEIEDECIYHIDNGSSLFKKCANCSHRTDADKPLSCTIKKNLDHIYSRLYIHRNRCAHNLMSYQQNLPSLKSLSSADYIYENYYIRFALLIIIDLIITELYRLFEKEYQSSVPQYNG